MTINNEFCTAVQNLQAEKHLKGIELNIPEEGGGKNDNEKKRN